MTVSFLGCGMPLSLGTFGRSESISVHGSGNVVGPCSANVVPAVFVCYFFFRGKKELTLEARDRWATFFFLYFPVKGSRIDHQKFKKGSLS
jgi:hypothetical protein